MNKWATLGLAVVFAFWAGTVTRQLADIELAIRETAPRAEAVSLEMDWLAIARGNARYLTDTTLGLQDGQSYALDELIGAMVILSSGEARTIIASNGSIVKVGLPWTTAYDDSIEYTIFAEVPK